MATAAKKAAPVAAKKAAPAPAAKKAAPKAAPVAAAEPEAVEGEGEELAFEVGQTVEFLGYGEGVPPEEQVLVAGEQYPVVAITEDEGVEGEEGFIAGGNPVLQFPNPEFNAKKKEHPETNPKMIEVEAYAEEVQILEDAEAEPEAEAEVAAAPAPAAKAKAAPAKAAAAAPAKAGKAVVAAKAPAGKKAAPKAPAVVEPPAEEELPDLDGEDEEVLALVADPAEILANAQELESRVGTTEYQLGGVLYHLRKGKSYLDLEGGAEYAGNEGWKKFLSEYFTIDYRKAMYLIEIYVNFTQSGIENPAAHVASIGWTKASKIAKLMVAEGADPEALVTLASENTVPDLSTAIKEQVEVGGTKTKGETKTRLTLKFRFFEEEAKTVDEILKAAQEQLGLIDTGDALLRIVTEWSQANGGAAQADAASAPKQTKPVAKVAAKRAAVKA